MSRRWAALGLCLALAGPGAAARAAQAPPPGSREQALEDLTRGGVESRRRAAARLGEVGRMDDAPALLRALRDPDALVRALAEDSVWRVWSRSGDPEVDALFQIGVEQMQQGAGGAAVETFTRVIERRPDFAEGWNKRATVYFLLGEYARSLRDCDEVVKRNPDHFGALAGYGQIYLRLDRPERALEYFQQALRVNPNLAGVEAAVEQLMRMILDRRRDTS